MSDELIHDRTTIAVLLERSENARKQLDALVSQVGLLQSTIESLKTSSLRSGGDFSSLISVLTSQLNSLKEQIENIEQDIKDMKTEILKLKENTPFINLLKSWSSYVGLLIISLLIFAIWHVIFNKENPPPSPKETPPISAGPPALGGLLHGEPGPEKGAS